MGGYGSQNRRKSRGVAVAVAVALVVGLGLFFAHLGRKCKNSRVQKVKTKKRGHGATLPQHA